MIPEKPYKADGLHEEPTTPKPKIKIVAQNADPNINQKKDIIDEDKRIK
jgi:hypothetical protein